MADLQDPAADGGGDGMTDITDLPQDIVDQISRYVGLPDRGNLRLLARTIGARFSGEVFRAVRFHDVPQRVLRQLQLFCDVAEEEERHRPRDRIPLAEFMRLVRIITIQPVQHGSTVATRSRPWMEALNDPRGRLSLDPAMPSVLRRSISLMTHCTHLELVLHHLDCDTERRILHELQQTAHPWEQVKSLRVSAERILEEIIIERMVPNLDSLQFSDFLHCGYLNGRPAPFVHGEGVSDDGTLLPRAEMHPDLERLHITIRRCQHLSFELLPPIHLFKRLVTSFPKLQWLGVDVTGRARTAPGTHDPDGFIVQHATELGTVLAGLSQLKRLAVTAIHQDMSLVAGEGPFRGTDDRKWGLLFNTLSSKLSEKREVELAIVGKRPVIYLRHWDMSESKSRVAYYLAGETKGWPVSLRDEPEDDLPSHFHDFIKDGDDDGEEI